MEPYNEGVSWLSHRLGVTSGCGLDGLFPLVEEQVPENYYKVFLNDHFDAIMKHFRPDESDWLYHQLYDTKPQKMENYVFHIHHIQLSTYERLFYG